MCGRYTMHHSSSQVEIRFGVTRTLVEPAECDDIVPTQQVAVMINSVGVCFLDSHQWGLIPSWAKEPGISNRIINVRAETVAENASYRQALSSRRCLIPADGFYEWKTEDGVRQPMYIRRRDGQLFAFAGLWEEWKQPDGTPLRTCTFITTTSNEIMLPIHDRMPAILLPDDERIWLNVAHRTADDVLSLLHPYPAELLEAYPVVPRANIPAIEAKELLNSL